MAGLTYNGFTIKRLPEVVVELKEQAQPIFQDLVMSDDVVDTSDSSTIGRFIGLVSLPVSDLWEAAQQLYLAFDPNSATGIALDNLVMYAGLDRNPASVTTSTVVVWGDPGTTIPITQVARAIDNTLYNIALPIVLSQSSCIGVRVEIPGNVVAGAYTININVGSTTRTITYTATGGETVDTAYNYFASNLNVLSSDVTATIENNRLTVELNDIFEVASITTTGNINVVKVKSRGEVRNQVVGSKEQLANSINAIATPMLGWDSINNPFDAIIGEDQETDDELRERFRDSKYVRASNISDSLYAALLEVDGVQYVGIYENETDIPDPATGLPAHSFKAVVQGGSPTQIAQEIWKNKPLGIGAEGNTFGTIVDSQGVARNINFERPIPQPIYITMELSVDQTLFPANGIEEIKVALINYFRNNLEIGDDVIFSRLYTPINSVPGHQVNSLKIGTAANPTGTANIPIPYNGVASLNDENIIITIV
jgi:uncharacterized phage protein gp47/JayE